MTRAEAAELRASPVAFARRYTFVAQACGDAKVWFLLPVELAGRFAALAPKVERGAESIEEADEWARDFEPYRCRAPDRYTFAAPLEDLA